VLDVPPVSQRASIVDAAPVFFRSLDHIDADAIA